MPTTKELIAALMDKTEGAICPACGASAYSAGGGDGFKFTTGYLSSMCRTCGQICARSHRLGGSTRKLSTAEVKELKSQDWFEEAMEWRERWFVEKGLAG